MPPVPTIAKLPPEVRLALDRRLHDAGFGDTVAIAAWLTECGHPVGKSAVAAYAKANRERIAGLFEPQNGFSDQARRADTRLRCLELARHFVDDEKDLYEAANRLLSWVDRP